MTTLADRLKTERESQGLTQDALAKKVGRKKRQSLISNIEAGTYKSSPYLPEIAYALGLQAMWLKTGLGPKHIYPESAAAPTAIAEPEASPYPAKIIALNPENRLRKELAELAARMSDTALQVLIYEAKKIDKEYPPAQASNGN